jgi:predicted ATPase/class 3 adenylate cyclase
VVTLCFTDIESSTQVQERIGAAYATVLMRHRALIKEAFEAHHGLIISAEGEEFFAAFDDAGAAVGATIDAQRALEREPWPEGAPIRVRMGLHTGTPAWTDHEYVGLDVVRAARISAAAHGGQVLMSGSTRSQLPAAPAGFSLKALGIHRLKGLNSSEAIYQVVCMDLAHEFPPPRTLARPVADLPVVRTSLIGRARELEDLAAAVAARPLATITGPGGAGKTRLAIECARLLGDGFVDGVCFVGLAALGDASHLTAAVGDALAIPGASTSAIVTAVRDHRLLLVLDNAEHIIEAVRVLVVALAECPGVTVLVTSREPLALPAEFELRLAPLHAPAPSATEADIAASPAVRLFMERAQSVRPGVSLEGGNGEAVASICRSLDGLPLAIELAAARSRLLTPAQIAQQLDQPLALELPAGAADQRHASLRATIEWSYRLLTPDQQLLFRHAAVFHGPFTPEAATAVLPRDNSQRSVSERMEGLALRSLVQVGQGPSGGVAFSLLTAIRAYGAEELEREGEAAAAAERHLLWLRDWAFRSSQRPDQALHVAEISGAITDIRAALTWALDHAGTAGLSLAVSAATFWWQRAPSEGIDWLERSLAAASDVSPSLRVRALYHLAFLSGSQRRPEETVAIAEECLRAADQIGRTTPTTVMALNILGESLVYIGELERAGATCARSLATARGLNDARLIGFALGPTGIVAAERGDLRAARQAWEESCEQFERAGDLLLLASPLAWLGGLTLSQGDLVAAERYIARAHRMLRHTDDWPRIGEVITQTARLRLLQGRPRDAAVSLREAMDVFRTTPGMPASRMGWPLSAAAELAASREHWATALQLIGHAERIATGPASRAVRRPEVARVRAEAEQHLGALAADEARDAARVSSLEAAVALVQEVCDGA